MYATVYDPNGSHFFSKKSYTLGKCYTLWKYTIFGPICESQILEHFIFGIMLEPYQLLKSFGLFFTIFYRENKKVRKKWYTFGNCYTSGSCTVYYGNFGILWELDLCCISTNVFRVFYFDCFRKFQNCIFIVPAGCSLGCHKTPNLQALQIWFKREFR